MVAQESSKLKISNNLNLMEHTLKSSRMARRQANPLKYLKMINKTMPGIISGESKQ